MEVVHRSFINNSKSLFLASADQSKQLAFWEHFKNLLLRRLERSRNKMAGLQGCALLELILHIAFRFSSLRYQIIAFVFALASAGQIAPGRPFSSAPLSVSC
ncbi:unnamed protein product, partial [Cyprideis torosa]